MTLVSLTNLGDNHLFMLTETKKNSHLEPAVQTYFLAFFHVQQYGLTAAPASQPRNAIVGQAVALVIAQLIGTRTEMDIWLKQSIATSLAIAVMAKLGVIHPPAGTFYHMPYSLFGSYTAWSLLPGYMTDI